MKEILFLLFLYILLNISFEQNQNYCDLNHNCNNCTYCGDNNEDYCTCDFYNSYCLNPDTLKYNFSFDFLLKYDGCKTNNGNMQNICGTSDITLKKGENKTISFPETTSSNFLCYYNFQKSEKNNNNKMGIKLQNNGDNICKFDFYYILYKNDSVTLRGQYSENILTSNFLETIHSNCDKISIYLDIEDPKYLEKLSITFTNIEEIEATTTPTTNLTTTPTTTPTNKITPVVRSNVSSGSSHTGLIIGIIIGGIALVIGIIVTIILFKNRNRKPDNINLQKDSNNNTTVYNSVNNELTTNNYSEFTNIINTNKLTMDNLFQTELLPKIFNKNNAINDCYNCTICMEDFIDNSSVVITTKCGHTFHQKCFKNWAYKNILCPKCPNCNYLILGPESENILQKISIPAEYSLQTGGFNTTLGITQ